MSFMLLGSFIGGIGLFLLGMRLMSDGLKLAAGPALHHILGQWTRTPARGLLSGILITSMVQSSSAVTVAIIGFVNAGLLSMTHSIGVIYGANVGTTTTSWLVAMVGFKFDVKLLALPLIGIGVGMRLTGGDSRRTPLGDALTGFGLFFLGVDVLKTAFEGLGERVPLAELGGGGVSGILTFVGIGFLLTLMMQSSSAAIALILTATLGGVVPLSYAAAAVIGANVGTTSTAAFAVIGATANAKRVATAHVLFNLVVAVAALLMLPLMLALVSATQNVLGMQESPALTLALFHTASKLLGVVLMWRLTPRLVVMLEGLFRTAEEDLSRPRYLDKNVLATPVLAMDALALELARISAIARTMGQSVLSAERGPSKALQEDRQAVFNLFEAVNRFSVAMQRANLPADLDESLPNALRVARYYMAVADISTELDKLQAQATPIHDAALASEMQYFRADAVKLLQACDPAAEDYQREQTERTMANLEDAYQSLKAHLLRAGSDGRLAGEQMLRQLEIYSRFRRLLQQMVKGGSYLGELLELAASYRYKQDASQQKQGAT